MSHPRRVLLVDDQQPTRKALRALLDLAPDVAWVGEAADGQEAIDMVEACAPDIVLMDIRMAGMDGLQATQRIKSRWPQIKIVVLTLYGECRDPALAAGADDFLVKGGPPACLIRAVREP